MNTKITTNQILNDIRYEILEGNYKINEKLPSKDYFAEYYNVSKTSIQNVLDILKVEGWITSIPKKGFFVSNNIKKKYRMFFHENLIRDNAKHSVYEESGVTVIQAEDMLEVPSYPIHENTACYSFSDRLLDEQLIVVYEERYLFERPDMKMSNNIFSKLFTSIGHDTQTELLTLHHIIRCRNANDRDKELFKDYSNFVITSVERYYVDDNNFLVGAAVSLCRSQYVHKEMDLV